MVDAAPEESEMPLVLAIFRFSLDHALLQSVSNDHLKFKRSFGAK
jgi:hypothetical protein